MRPTTDPLRRTATRLGLVGVPLLALATGPAAAHGSGGYGGGMMGGGMMGGTWGPAGGAGMLGGWLVWPLLLVGLVLLLVYGLAGREDRGDGARAELRARYARGDLSDEEYVSRRETLDRTA